MKDEELGEEIVQTLHDLRTPTRLEQSPWVRSCLVSMRLSEEPEATQHEALRGVFTDVLEQLEEANSDYADLLRGLYWEGLTWEKMMEAQRPRRWSSVTTFNRHRKNSLDQFVYILSQKEQACRRELQPARDVDQVWEQAESETLLIPQKPWFRTIWFLGVTISICFVVVGVAFSKSPLRSHMVQLVQPPVLTPTILNDMAYVPTGPFHQGSTPDQLEFFEKLCIEAKTDCRRDYFEDELPQREVTLSAFFIDVHEVTNKRFQNFVESTGYITTAESRGKSRVFFPALDNFVEIPGADWQHPGGPGTSIMGRMNHPVVHVSWEDAKAYCERDRSLGLIKRLPTEAEWEKAARGLERLLFPWGDEWDPEAGNYSMVMSDGKVTERGLRPVGRYLQDASPYGVKDLLGNISEWVADVYDPDYYQVAPDRNPHNTTVPKTRPDGRHSRRGGSWATRPGYLHSAWRIDRPDESSDTIGFRCARHP